MRLKSFRDSHEEEKEIKNDLFIFLNDFLFMWRGLDLNDYLLI
jgi:hypothetical protein